MIGVRKTSLFWIIGQLIWEWIKMNMTEIPAILERQEHSGKWVGSLRVTRGSRSSTTRSADTKETWGSVIIPFGGLSQLQLGYNML